ncbi:MAG TPA: type II secretion system major pseudopilin GspG [Fimbriimonadaceae bacterium]|mgnify:CR=1 FL=1|nr:type II secretion system major pseudopilin GspG [Fimbriimonadaceae bacterium]
MRSQCSPRRAPTRRRADRRRRIGFTLIELLVVILILAILAALIVPRVVGRTSDAKISKAKADISSLSGMIQQFRLDCGRYPTTEEGLQALRVPPADVQGWKGPYSTKELPDDPWNNPYIYEYPGTAGSESYIVMTYGSDGQEGGDPGTEAEDISEGD